MKDVKWFLEVYRRGTMRIQRTVRVAMHAPTTLPDGGEDLQRCGTALVTVTGRRPQYVAVLRAKLGQLTFRAYESQGYTTKEKARAAADNARRALEARGFGQ